MIFRNIDKRVVRTLALLLLSAWAGCLQAVVTVAVLDPIAPDVQENITATILSELQKAMVESGKFQVVERRNLDMVLAEQRFSMEDFTQQSTVYRLGQLLEAEYLLISEATMREGRIYLYLALTDVATGETLYPQTMLVRSDAESIAYHIEQAITRLSARFEIQGQVVKVDGQSYLINLGDRDPIEIGSILKVYRNSEPVYEPGTFRLLGFDRQPVGQLIVQEILAPHLARTERIEGEGIASGDQIVLIEQPEAPVADDQRIRERQPLYSYRYTQFEISTVPDGIELYLDNEYIGDTGYREPLVFTASAGLHFLRLQRDTYRTEYRTIQAGKEPRTRMLLHIDPDWGHAWITTNPTGAELFLDDRYHGVTPTVIRMHREGRFVLRLRKTGFETEDERIRITRSESRDYHFDLEAEDEPGNAFTPPGMTLVRGGTFMMGTDDKERFPDAWPPHEVWIDDFFMDRHEVMVKEYRQFCEVTGYPMPTLPDWVQDTHPMTNVSWYDAEAYASWCGKRLPTEAEWEYAAREIGSLDNGFPDSIHVRSIANIDGVGGNDTYPMTAPVGSLTANTLGIYDLWGNVYEWCSDWYDRSAYSYSVSRNPDGPRFGNRKVIRGGCWAFGVEELSIYGRNLSNPSAGSIIIGFRCVRSAIGE